MDLSDMPKPAGGALAVTVTAGLTPQQILQFYSPDVWEEFVREIVETLDQDYLTIKRLGGPGDHGADVAAMWTEAGLEGPWDCFQCKHYTGSLMPSDVWPEMLKVLRAVVAGEYAMPQHYTFVAPKGAGLTLNPLMSKPTKLKEQFLKWLATSKVADGLGAGEKAAVEALAGGADFSIFDVMPTADIVNIHARSRYHEMRFGLPLKVRSPGETPPPDFRPIETRYVDQLIAVYTERHSTTSFARATLATDQKVGAHFVRQRASFYKAESLRLYSRDATPDGTFEALQDDVHAGVIETVESDHPTGYARLQKTLEVSSALPLAQHQLVQLVDLEDRKGICHQLVNDNRLTWLEETS